MKAAEGLAQKVSNRLYAFWNKIKKPCLYVIGVLTFVVVLDNWAMGGAMAAFGIVGLLVFIAAFKLISKRAQFKLVCGQIESMIWGKPLDKMYWGEGELKSTKVKLVLKKRGAKMEGKTEKTAEQLKKEERKKGNIEFAVLITVIVAVFIVGVLVGLSL